MRRDDQAPLAPRLARAIGAQQLGDGLDRRRPRSCPTSRRHSGGKWPAHRPSVDERDLSFQADKTAWAAGYIKTTAAFSIAIPLGIKQAYGAKQQTTRNGNPSIARMAAITKLSIERALDELNSFEEGFRFQALAVVLARQKWPGLIAHEPKKDNGLDAYEPASVSTSGKGHGLACSITKERIFDKIKGDAITARAKYPELRILTFATPHPVTQLMAQKWAKELREIDATKDVELILLPRQEIITSLLLPENEGLCRSLLNMPAAETPHEGNLLERVLAATAEIADKWRVRTHRNERPSVPLSAISLDDEGKETDQIIDEFVLRDRLYCSRRTSLEAPGGRGKTTTLARLAIEHQRDGEVFLLIDMAAWIRSAEDILDYAAKDPAFRSRSITAVDLACLRQKVHFSFLLNGWNEIAESLSGSAVVAVEELDRAYPDAGIIVATRAHAVNPPLPGCLRVRLLPLSRAKRIDYLRLVLKERADELRLRIEGSTILDELTRTPLILNQVISLFESGAPIPETKVGVLEAATKLLEAEHRSHLQATPLSGRATRYLSELAHEMTRRGEILTGQDDSNRAIQSVIAKLTADGQFISPPNPDVVLQVLCAHHVLERIEHETVSYRFQHQQFQEFYASRYVLQVLTDLVAKRDRDADKDFARSYIDKPIWEEALFMVAEDIGHLVEGQQTQTRGEGMGSRLIELASRIDPVFAANLSFLGGSALWPVVRDELSATLRKWHDANDPSHKQLALAGMLATGSDDFLDIIGPALSHEERRDRIRTYVYGFSLHLSSLGPDWRRTIAAWSEDARSDFVYNMSHSAGVVDALEDVALSDPSLEVRRRAIEGMCWNDAQDMLGRVISQLDEATLAAMLPGLDDSALPPASRVTVANALRRSIKPAMPPLQRLQLLIRARRLGADITLEELKTALDAQQARIDPNGVEALRLILEAIQKDDPDWVATWVVARLTDGTLWGDHWSEFLRPMPASSRLAVIKELATTELGYPKLNAYKTLFGTETTPDGAAELFTKLSEFQRTRVPGSLSQTWKFENQLREVLHAIRFELAVAGINRCLPSHLDEGTALAIIEFFGQVNPGTEDIRGRLTPAQRQSLRCYIKDTIAHALTNNELSGETRTHAAIALGRIGEPEDINDIRRLIDADIHRLDAPRRPSGGLMMYANRFIHALQLLNPPGLEAYLLELLQDSHYENDVSRTLLQIAIPMDPGSPFVRGVAFDEIWRRRESSQRTGVDEHRARRFADALRQRIDHHKARQAIAGEADRAIGRMKALAVSLAVIDGKRSADLVTEVMQLPGKWDEHGRMAAVRALLISGARLTTATIFAVLNPAIEALFTRGIHQESELSLLMDCLVLLPFGDNPDRGIARIRQVLARLTHRPHSIQDLITALGYSRSKAAVPLLIQLGRGKGGLGENMDVWVQALGRLATPSARRTLLAYVDPAIRQSGIELSLNFAVLPRLAGVIGSWARDDDALRARLLELVGEPLTPAQKMLLVAVYAELGSDEALLADPEILQSRFFFSDWREAEQLYVDRKQNGHSYSYTLEPRNAEMLRARLFQLVLNDPTRRRSALAGLGRIEVSRLEIGRPPGEPRHPMIDSGRPWPPLDLLDFS